MKKFPLIHTLFALPLCVMASENKVSERPNIILICADDMGFSDLGCYGSEISTPNIDKLAKAGLMFNNCHNVGKSFPSRACLITGMYAQNNGYSNSPKSTLDNCVTMGEVLGLSGYRTLWSGKHHGKENPYTRGYDRYFGLKDGACNYFNPGKQREGEPMPAQKSHKRGWCIDDKMYAPYTPPEKDFYTTDYFTNYALGWLEEYKDEEKPFFLYLAYNAPHDPLQAWPKDIAKYKGKYKDGYDAIRKARYEKQLKLGIIDEKWALSEPTHGSWASLSEKEQNLEQRRMEVYAAMIECLDRNVGRVVHFLKKTKQLDNTIIIFISDNGASPEVVNLKYGSGNIGAMDHWESLGVKWANVCNTPFRFYKSDSYEGGIATPMIISWTKGLKAKGEVSNSLLHFVDILPTLCDVTNSKYPSEYKGRKVLPYSGESFLPLIEGDLTWKRKDPLFWQWGKGSAMSDGEWKIVKLNRLDPWSLYNIAKDPTETTDLSKKHPEIVKKLNDKYTNWYYSTEIGKMQLNKK